MPPIIPTLVTPPADVFTEPNNVDPDTLANLGPLRPLAGRWSARKGVDLNPKADGAERRVFMGTIDFQLLYGLRYHIHVTTEEDDITFHEQVGYWLWEPATGLVMQTIAIPRGQVALASGQAEPNATEITISATRGPTDYGICSTSFLEQAFRIDSYRITITFHTDGSWSYVTNTELMVQGRNASFAHQDCNTLHRVGDAKPNPLAAVLAKRKAL